MLKSTVWSHPPFFLLGGAVILCTTFELEYKGVCAIFRNFVGGFSFFPFILSPCPWSYIKFGGAHHCLFIECDFTSSRPRLLQSETWAQSLRAYVCAEVEGCFCHLLQLYKRVFFFFNLSLHLLDRVKFRGSRRCLTILSDKQGHCVIFFILLLPLFHLSFSLHS